MIRTALLTLALLVTSSTPALADPSFEETVQFLRDNAGDATWFYQPGNTLDSPYRRLTNLQADKLGNVTMAFALKDCQEGKATIAFSVRDVDIGNPMPRRSIVGFSCGGKSCIKMETLVNACLSPKSRASVRLGWGQRLENETKSEVQIDLNGNQGESFVKALAHYQGLVGGKKKSLF